MSEVVAITCPYCGHTTEQKMGGGLLFSDWLVENMNGDMVKARGEGRGDCGECKKSFSYYLTRKIVCMVSRLDYVESSNVTVKEKEDE